MRDFYRCLVVLLASWMFVASTSGTAQAIPLRVLESSRATPGMVEARFMGTSTILFDDGTDQILIDGFFTRPGWATVGCGLIAPNSGAIQTSLARAGINNRLRAVLVAHSHYDHALDAPTVARRTGAQLVGSVSTRNIGLGGGLSNNRIQVVADGDQLTFGAFRITVFSAPHSPNALFPGTITSPLGPPARASRYREGGNFSFLIEHRGFRILVQPSANFSPRRYRNVRADIVFLGIGALGRQSSAFTVTYWREVVHATGARLVIPIHWDDFFQPVGTEFAAMPLLFDNVVPAMNRARSIGARAGVRVRAMPAFEPVDMASAPSQPLPAVLRLICQHNAHRPICMGN
jgi:L-ascorbate metabolism protein UlaG (beta-lactamase superfamily)